MPGGHYNWEAKGGGGGGGGSVSPCFSMLCLKDDFCPCCRRFLTIAEATDGAVAVHCKGKRHMEHCVCLQYLCIYAWQQLLWSCSTFCHEMSRLP